MISQVDLGRESQPSPYAKLVKVERKTEYTLKVYIVTFLRYE